MNDNGQISVENKGTGMSKKEFFDIYEKAKKLEIDVKTLDKETIKRILTMAIEELNINSNRIKEKSKNLKKKEKKNSTVLPSQKTAMQLVRS